MTDIKETQETRPIMPGTEDSDRSLVELTHVEKHYGDLHVLKDINLTVKK
ncbi:MAG: amino acid ABC transporter ATP-binding protein, partial [Bifidobacterium sp.]